MTWNELVEAIQKMPAEQREETVLYHEPYDDEAEIFAVDLHKATEKFENDHFVILTGGTFLQ